MAGRSEVVIEIFLAVDSHVLFTIFFQLVCCYCGGTFGDGGTGCYQFVEVSAYLYTNAVEDFDADGSNPV